ncbi:MAG TPA: YXWGXW repeat-containing protein [Candidatus Saccharimonadales bacterium]|nr:YXWGXW repeat-containing protein [Candidatus Saccharimonadales bacterium]
MKKMKLIKSILGLSIPALMVAGCEVGVRGPGGEAVVSTAPPPAVVAPYGEVYADAAPPAPYDEPVVGVAPGAGYVWIGGSWIWGGNRWNWERGRWERPPHAGARWVPHHYEYRNGRHVFHRGGWR